MIFSVKDSAAFKLRVPVTEVLVYFIIMISKVVRVPLSPSPGRAQQRSLVLLGSL